MSQHPKQNGKALSASLMLGALGVVYGDIGTSPLYAFKLTLSGANGLTVTQPHILGALSLIFWALMITVTLKFVVIMLRADNHGEGGVMALGALASRGLPKGSKRRFLFTGLSVVGFALFFGDSLITPAISVLSAVEGLNTATTIFTPYVVIITSAILIALFLIQSRGTHRVGIWFGPIMVVWFVVLALMGLSHIVHEPSVLFAVNPVYAFDVIADDPMKSLLVLGFVVLATTGCEALYADMGHFGARPIRLCWYGLVLPALLLNYMGQGALLLQRPGAIDNLFFEMAPSWALYPLVALSTLATIIASQAVISGLFSMTQQAVSLGFLPRMRILHTSADEIGQIYVPRMNWIAMVGVMALVFAFGSSEKLANAYGVAVTGVVLVDSVMVSYVAYTQWRWRLWICALIFGCLFLIDAVFFTSTAIKVFEGGWFPLLIAFILYGVIQTWRRGRTIMFDKLYKDALSMEDFLVSLNKNCPRVPGTAVFMTTDVRRVPKALLHNLRHNKIVHDRVIILRVKVHDVPWVGVGERLEVKDLGRNFYAVVVHYGFMEQPDVPQSLALLALDGWDIDLKAMSYFLSRETIIASHFPGLGPVERKLFISLAGMAENATSYFRVPTDRVLELGTRVEI